jgi:hypothetical protein
MPYISIDLYSLFSKLLQERGIFCKAKAVEDFGGGVLAGTPHNEIR